MGILDSMTALAPRRNRQSSEHQVGGDALALRNDFDHWFQRFVEQPWSIVTGGTVRYWIYSAKGVRASEVASLTVIAGLTFWLGNTFVLSIGMVWHPAAASAMDQLPPAINRLIALGGLLAIFAYLGCSRLEEPLNRFKVTAAVHGHAHRGALEAKTTTGVPVYNVSMPLLKASFPNRPAFRLLTLPKVEPPPHPPAEEAPVETPVAESPESATDDENDLHVARSKRESGDSSRRKANGPPRR